MSDDIEVHPLAAVWPMLSEPDLQDLAADIAENGQLHPILLDADGLLIDGRNRLAACRIAGVEPKFETYEGDPMALVLSAERRRHQTPGQFAMGKAVVLATAGKRKNGRWERGSVDNRQSSVSASAMEQAMRRAGTVLDFAADLALSVVSGARALNDAYTEARKRKEAGESEEARMAALTDAAPDLANLVIEETLTLSEAEARFTKRVSDERERRERATKSISEAVVSLWARLDGDDMEQVLADWLPEANPHANRQGIPDLFNTAGLRRVSGLVNRLADLVEKNGGQL